MCGVKNDGCHFFLPGYLFAFLVFPMPDFTDPEISAVTKMKPQKYPINLNGPPKSFTIKSNSSLGKAQSERKLASKQP